MSIEIGCCVIMQATENDPTGIGFAQQVKNLGFDYIELPMAQLMQYSNNEFAKITAYFKDIGIPCRSVNNFLPGHLKVTGTAINHDNIERYVDEALRRGYELGIDNIVFGSGGARNLDDGISPERGFEQLVDFLLKLSDKLKDSSVTVAIEQLNKKECNIINKLSECEALAKAVSRPNVGVLFDYYHMAMENEGSALLCEMKKENVIFFHGHIADPAPERGFPLNKDRIAGFACALKSIGYNNKLSIESYTNDFIKDASLGLKNIRELLA